MTPEQLLETQVLLQRKTLCLASDQPGIAAHLGDDGFTEGVTQHFQAAESDAAERVVELKAELKEADTETFWRRLMEGMTEICSAQYGFVAKRILVDDHDSAVEMPPIGEPGSCLMGVAFYYNDGQDPPTEGMHRDYKYLAWGAPCAHMRHDKIFLIPERLGEFITNNPNAFPFETEAYLGVPLFHEGKCFAHFGMMWTKEGLAKRGLGWGYLEMVLHSLEDVILERLLAGQSFAKDAPQTSTKVKKVIPQEAITTSQSLKPYARSLSHELRTPMQGVVGMLDVMHATVQEAIEGQGNAKIRNIFQALKENIEVVQDSSRRAVEAADNVVHAYDLNMQIPDTPQNANEDDSPLTAGISTTNVFDARPNILIEGSNIPVNPYKRRRSSPVNWSYGNPPKHRATKPSQRRPLSPRSQELKDVVHQSGEILRASPEPQSPGQDVRPQLYTRKSSTTRTPLEGDPYPASGIRHSNIRNLLHIVVNESLRVGGRPDSAIAEDTMLGEKIEVRTRTSSGQASAKLIEWSVDPAVPETILVDERDLTKLVSCVFLNAIKFTEAGTISVIATLSRNGRYVMINVTDTGSGMPKDFLPELFKPFSREDDSLTRAKEGLGLGLMVAKGIARKIGGDLNCIRSETTGPLRGTEFEIKVPLNSNDMSSRPGTPSNRTPTPSYHGSYFSGVDSTRKASTYHSRTMRESTAMSPLHQSSPSRANSYPAANLRNVLETPPVMAESPGPILPTKTKTPLSKTDTFDRNLAQKYPLTFLVAEDNKINRKLLVNMLSKLGYKDVYEAFDGKEAVRVMSEVLDSTTDAKEVTNGRKGSASGKGIKTKYKPVDVILMDLWMPEMDGYEATEHIFEMVKKKEEQLEGNNGLAKMDCGIVCPTVLAVSADVTDEAISKATTTGMEGFMTKPYKLTDLQRLIEEFCVRSDRGRPIGR